MLPQTSSIIAQKQEQGRLACISRWAARSAKLAGAAVVLGLDPSDRRYDTCIRSLDRSLAEWGQSQVVRTDRRACGDKGLEPGTSVFAVCVVNAEQSPTNTGGYGAIVPAR